MLVFLPDDIFNEQNKEISDSSSGSNEASLGSNDASLGLKEPSSLPKGSYSDEMLLLNN